MKQLFEIPKGTEVIAIPKIPGRDVYPNDADTKFTWDKEFVFHFGASWWTLYTKTLKETVHISSYRKWQLNPRFAYIPLDNHPDWYGYAAPIERITVFVEESEQNRAASEILKKSLERIKEESEKENEEYKKGYQRKIDSYKKYIDHADTYKKNQYYSRNSYDVYGNSTYEKYIREYEKYYYDKDTDNHS